MCVGTYADMGYTHEIGRTEMSKTLWILNYDDGRVGRIVSLYAENEHEAWVEIEAWATERDIKLPQNATLKHFPNGFQLNTRTLPGAIPENE